MKAQIKYFHLNQYSASSITLLREEMNNHIIKFTVQAATSENYVNVIWYMLCCKITILYLKEQIYALQSSSVLAAWPWSNYAVTPETALYPSPKAQKQKEEKHVLNISFMCKNIIETKVIYHFRDEMKQQFIIAEAVC